MNNEGQQLCSKETPTQVFSYEYCEIFKNVCFEEHLQTTASDLKTVLHKKFNYKWQSPKYSENLEQ